MQHFWRTLCLGVASVVWYMCLHDPSRRIASDKIVNEPSSAKLVIFLPILGKYAFLIFSMAEVYYGGSGRCLPSQGGTPRENPAIPIRTQFPGIPINDIRVQDIGLLILLVGGLFRIYSMRWLGRLFTFQLSIRESHTLITTGPYAWVRHPSYTGALLLVFGAGLALLSGELANVVGFQAPPAAAVLAAAFPPLTFGFGFLGKRMNAEERMLEDSFHRDWKAYIARTQYKLVPGMY